MEIFTTLVIIWVVTYTASFIMNSAQRANEQKQLIRAEDERQKRLDQLYGRD